MATAALEAAIPEYLRQERTIPSKLPADYQPPFPAYSARFSQDIKDLVMVTIGTQHEHQKATQSEEYKQIVAFVEKPLQSSKPCYWEAASVTDNRGYFNEVAIVYWRSKRDYESWTTESGFKDWWHGLKPEATHGWFIEVLLPSMDRLETVFSDNVVPEGAAHMREGVSGQIAEHVYWGSMRDRLPAGQNDDLAGTKGTIASACDDSDTRSRRMQVKGRKNLAIIRSGQDWSNTSPHERKLYLETMHPVLIKGMDFLRDHGDEVGCFSCRFMDVVDKTSPGATTDKTFGLALFDDLASLEGWSKHHPTHLNIFGRFIQYAGELQNNVSLRLFHEVMVLKSEQQAFEYIGESFHYLDLCISFSMY